MKPKYFICLCLLVLVTACATAVQHNTPSGKVETTINKVKRSTVSDALTEMMVNKGYSLIRSSDASLTFDRPITNTFAQFAYSSSYDVQPVSRATYTIIQKEGSVRVIGDFAAITNPGSAFERRTDLNQIEETLLLQDKLNSLKYDFERKRK